MARPARTGNPSTRRRQFRLSDEEDLELEDAAAELKTDASTIIREALAELLGDWREKRIFQRRVRHEPVEVERRTGGDRREPAADGATGG